MSKLEETRLSLEISRVEVEEDSVQAKLVKAAQEAHEKSKESVVPVANQVFLLCSNFL